MRPQAAPESIELRPDFRAASSASFRQAHLDCAAAAEAIARSALASTDDISLWVAASAQVLRRSASQEAFSFPLRIDDSSPRLLVVDAQPQETFRAWLARCEEQLRAPAEPVPGDHRSALSLIVGDCPWTDTSVELKLTPDRQRILVRYRDDLWRETTVVAWGEQWIAMLLAATDAPDRDCLEYSLLTAAARSLIPDPSVPLDRPRFDPVAELVLQTVQEQPQAPAVEHAGRTYTYESLAKTSESIAMSLVRGGLPKGSAVAVTGSRCFGFIAAMLGVWRAGGVLVNVDPALPEQRQLTMMSTTGATRLVRVGGEGSAAVVDAASNGIVSVSLDGAVASMDAAIATELPKVTADDPAYVFFTSGSTGTPKAVYGQHAGLSHFLTWQRQQFAIQRTDRASLLTALSFDVILRDAFLILTSGGVLCVPGEHDVLEPGRIVRWLQQARITTVHVVPSLARLWLRAAPENPELSSLARVFFAGEPLLDELVTQWRSVFSSSAKVINLYGPTETTLAKCFHEVTEPPDVGVQVVGAPIPNTQILLLNAAGVLCGLNEPGQIAIRTPFRTLGYLGNPEANAKSFPRNPFTEDAEDRIYLTGDSGSYRSDGKIAIYGRLDNQVKVRGVRIEPGEIEAALLRQELVSEAVVAPAIDPHGEKALVAYLVLAHHAEPRGAFPTIRASLRRELPDVMVPAAFVSLAALPLNPNGKVNRRALPAPTPENFVVSTGVAAETELERQLVAIWSAMLGSTAVGVEDDFFDLGGHSLLAVQLAQRISAELRRQCTLSILFRTRTIRRLAAEMELNRDDLETATVLTLQSEGEGPPLLCLVGLHLYQSLADRLAPDIPVHGVFLPAEAELLGDGDLDASVPRTIEEIAASYLAVIREAQPEGPYYLAGVSFGGVVAYEVAHQLEVAGCRVGFVAMFDSILPSARQRDWVEWGRKRAKRLREGGVAALADSGRRAFDKYMGSRLRRSAPSGADRTAALAKRRADFYQAVESKYRVPSCSAPVVLVRAADKSFFGGDSGGDIRDPTYGWSHGPKTLIIENIPGGHLTILDEPYVMELAQVVRKHRRIADR